MIQNRETADRVAWGDDCSAWELMGTAGLSVKQEEMPPGTSEVRHHHARAEQFFYVLSGVLTLEIEGVSYEVAPQSGIIVAPEQRHQATNAGPKVVAFLVISAPPTAEDRIEDI